MRSKSAAIEIIPIISSSAESKQDCVDLEEDFPSFEPVRSAARGGEPSVESEDDSNLFAAVL